MSQHIGFILCIALFCCFYTQSLAGFSAAVNNDRLRINDRRVQDVASFNTADVRKRDEKQLNAERNEQALDEGYDEENSQELEQIEANDDDDEIDEDDTDEENDGETGERARRRGRGGRRGRRGGRRGGRRTRRGRPGLRRHIRKGGRRG